MLHKGEERERERERERGRGREGGRERETKFGMHSVPLCYLGMHAEQESEYNIYI